MLRKLGIAIVLAIAAFVAAGLFLPSEYHLQRSISVQRPASTVFTLLNGYRTFNEWSPWASRDPGAIYTISGPDRGVGARLDWRGDPRLVGSGWQEITASRPFEFVRMRLDFGAQGQAESYFKLSGRGPQTDVVWGFETDVTQGQGFFGALTGRYFGLFLDRWVGSDYEQGLKNLKRFAESLPQADFGGADIQILDVVPVPVLYVPGSSSQESSDVADALAAAFEEISAFLARHGLDANGQPMAITRAWDEYGYRFDAALPVAARDLPLTGNLRSGLSPGGRVARIQHRGPYDRMLQSYEKLAAYMAAHGLRQGGASWEHYVSDPGETETENLLTYIYVQLDD